MAAGIHWRWNREHRLRVGDTRNPSVAGAGSTRITPSTLVVSCLRSSFAKALDLVEDGIRRGRPDKGFALCIAMREVAVNRGLERGNILKGAAANLLRRDLREEAVDLIEPVGAGRREVYVIPRVEGKPPGDLWHLCAP